MLSLLISLLILSFFVFVFYILLCFEDKLYKKRNEEYFSSLLQTLKDYSDYESKIYCNNCSFKEVSDGEN